MHHFERVFVDVPFLKDWEGQSGELTELVVCLNIQLTGVYLTPSMSVPESVLATDAPVETEYHNQLNTLLQKDVRIP